MNEKQQAHLNKIVDEAQARIIDKYTKGTIKYGSSLSEDYTAQELLEEAINEAIDQVTYLLTLREKL